MNITFLVNRDLRANVALNLLRPLFDKHQVTIFLSEQVGVPKPGWSPCESLLQLKFFEQQLFNQVILPQAEQRPEAEKRFLSFTELGALGGGCSVLENINRPEGLAKLAETAPDLIISIRYGKILKAQALALPPLGVLNLHSGLLPKYQGILTTLHSLNAGELEVGCTLHYIDSAEIDTGHIVAQAPLPVGQDKSLFWHVSALYPLGCQLLIDALDAMESGEELVSYPQDASQQQYFGLPEAKDFELLQEKGFEVWQPDDVLELLRLYVADPSSEMTEGVNRR